MFNVSRILTTKQGTHINKPLQVQWLAAANSGLLYFVPARERVGGEFWQSVIHWRGEWQTTAVFLPWEPHEQYEKVKR